MPTWQEGIRASRLKTLEISGRTQFVARPFPDERALLIDDPDHSADEERFVLLGLSSSLRLLVVAHCDRSAGKVIRIISARKATVEEERHYP